MPEHPTVLLVAPSAQQCEALLRVAGPFVGADVGLFVLEASAASTDSELAWGVRRRLSVREIAPGGETAGPPMERPLGPDGDVSTAILDVARDLGVDLIVIANPRQSWFRRLVDGSAAHGVLRRSDVPVLAVPEPIG